METATTIKNAIRDMIKSGDVKIEVDISNFDIIVDIDGDKHNATRPNK